MGSDLPDGTASPAGAAYTADRAAALAGIPLSTLHYWARKRIWIPGVSDTRIKRWSFADLLALRLIDWLRRDKPKDENAPKIPMRQIRRALSSVESFGERVKDRSVKVTVDRSGFIVLDVQGEVFIPLEGGSFTAPLSPEWLDLVDEWKVHKAIRGPHLFEPRPSLRIIPGKLSGEPHADGTRIPSRMVWSLKRQGLGAADIIELYPRLTQENIDMAIDLENELERNLRHDRSDVA
jgi:uncharacterized protein (DUF433 family)/DNA-binding transcriptional MerR regulator